MYDLAGQEKKVSGASTNIDRAANTAASSDSCLEDVDCQISLRALSTHDPYLGIFLRAKAGLNRSYLNQLTGSKGRIPVNLPAEPFECTLLARLIWRSHAVTHKAQLTRLRNEDFIPAESVTSI